MNQIPISHDYAKAFRIVRAAFGLRQAELATRLSITPSQLSLIEAGKRRPSLRVVGGMAKVLGIPTALITLLASTQNEMESGNDQDISDLARTLLRVLVSARGDSQQSLSLDG